MGYEKVKPDYTNTFAYRNSIVLYIDLLSQTDCEGVTEWFSTNFVKPHDSYSQILYSAHDLHLASKQSGKCMRITQQTKQKRYEFLQEEHDSLFVVVVIGESFIRSHSSLYGYPLPTSTELTKERDNHRLVVFNDVISPWPQTSPTIRSVLCTNSISDGEMWYNSLYFPAIFKQAGFNVQFWDN